MNAPLRRGLCPTLAEPMQTGDGLLVRLNPVASGFLPKTLIGLCEAALLHGNGIVEVTARGNLQIRGLTARSAMGLSRDVDALGIAVRTGVPVETGPLAGHDPEEVADPTPLAENIRKGVAEARLETRLGPKVSVVVDGGGRPDMDDVIADVRLTAQHRDGGIAWRLAMAGNAVTARPLLADLNEDAACNGTLAILSAIAELGRQGRARDLTRESLERVVSKDRHPALPPSVLPDISSARGEIGSFDANASSQASAIGEIANASVISPPVGEMSGRTDGRNLGLDAQSRGHGLHDIIPLADARFAVSIALPFGQIHASTVIDFVSAAARLGAAEIRLAPQRALLLICPSQASAKAVRDAAQTAGFVVDAADPRCSIAACSGSPACASGHIPARAIAAEIAAAMPDGVALDLHVTGCEKRCAKPGHQELTILGRPNSAALVLGSAGTTPLAHVAREHAAAAFGRVAKLIAAERKPGETETACLYRLGKRRLAQTFVGER